MQTYIADQLSKFSPRAAPIRQFLMLAYASHKAMCKHNIVLSGAQDLLNVPERHVQD
jgi:hypothetical protein